MYAYGSSIAHDADVPSRETLDAFVSSEFLAGFTFGSVAVVLGIVVAILLRRRVHAPAPIVAALLTGAALGGLETTRGLPSDL